VIKPETKPGRATRTYLEKPRTSGIPKGRHAGLAVGPTAIPGAAAAVDEVRTGRVMTRLADCCPASPVDPTGTPPLWANHATPRPAGSVCRSSDMSVLTALVIAGEPHQPAYLSHSHAAAAPVDRFTQRQTLIVGHRPQRLPSAQLSVPHESIAFSKRGQHRDRQSFEPAFPVGPFLRSTAWASNAERRAACLTDGWLITSPSSTPALHSAVSGRRRLERSSPTMSTCFAYPQPISRSAVRHTSSAVWRSASSGDELW
jgi:hypothetical protein